MKKILFIFILVGIMSLFIKPVRYNVLDTAERLQAIDYYECKSIAIPQVYEQQVLLHRSEYCKIKITLLNKSSLKNYDRPENN